MEDKKMKELMKQVQEDTQKAMEISNSLKEALRKVPGISDDKIPLNVVMVGIADFVTEVSLGAGESLTMQGASHDLDMSVHAMYGKFNSEATLLLRNKLQQIMIEDEMAKKDSTSH